MNTHTNRQIHHTQIDNATYIILLCNPIHYEFIYFTLFNQVSWNQKEINFIELCRHSRSKAQNSER
jgi:hypothetical protein